MYSKRPINESSNSEIFNNADPFEILTLIDLGMIETANAKLAAYVAKGVLEKYGKHITHGLNFNRGDVYFEAVVSDTHMMDMWQGNHSDNISCTIAYYNNTGGRSSRVTDKETVIIRRGEILSNEEAQRIADVILRKLQTIISRSEHVNESNQQESKVPFDEFVTMSEIGIYDASFLRLTDVGRLIIDNYGVVGATISLGGSLDDAILEFRTKTKRRTDIRVILGMSENDKRMRIVTSQLFRHHNNNSALKYEWIDYADPEQSAIRIANIVLQMVKQIDERA